MATSVRVELKLDHLRELTYGGPMSAMLWRKAQAVYSVAKARAPVASGNYRDSFRIAWADTDRNVARVYNDADYALRLELGGVPVRGRDANGRYTKAGAAGTKHRTLGNALDAAGGA